MAGKVSSHCGFGILFNVKVMTFEPVNYSVPSLSNIFCIAYVAIQATSKIIALVFDLLYV